MSWVLFSSLMFRRKSDRGRIDSKLGKEKRITKKKQGGVVVVMVYVCTCVSFCFEMSSLERQGLICIYTR